MALILGDMLAIGVVLALVAMYALPDKALRITDGILLLLLGLFPVLYILNVIHFNINSYVLIRFIALYLVIDVGSMLFSEAITEENVGLKIFSMVVGLFIVLVTSIPWMQEFGAISFKLPSYSPYVDLVLYIVAGMLAVVGAFKAEDT
jgi:hypothetical protein